MTRSHFSLVIHTSTATSFNSQRADALLWKIFFRITINLLVPVVVHHLQAVNFSLDCPSNLTLLVYRCSSIALCLSSLSSHTGARKRYILYPSCPLMKVIEQVMKRRLIQSPCPLHFQSLNLVIEIYRESISSKAKTQSSNLWLAFHWLIGKICFPFLSILCPCFLSLSLVGNCTTLIPGHVSFLRAHQRLRRSSTIA